MLLTVTLNPTVDKSYDVDNLELGEVNRVRELRQTAAGKGIQVAKVARLLGESVAATGFIGGHIGHYIDAFLQKAEINTEFVQVEEETRTCININDLSTGKQTEVLEPGAPIQEEKKAEFFELYKKLLKKSDIVAICGSVPVGIDETFYPRLIEEAKKIKKSVLFDASGKLLRHGIAACPDVIKPNQTELMELIGRELHTHEEIIAAARELSARGIGTVIISLGKDGAVFVTPQGVYRGTTPDIPIVNTIGCGDSMVAGFAVGLLRGLPMEETIRMAMAVSTANALRKETGYFVQEDYVRLLGMVSAFRLE